MIPHITFHSPMAIPFTDQNTLSLRHQCPIFGPCVLLPSRASASFTNSRKSKRPENNLATYQIHVAFFGTATTAYAEPIIIPMENSDTPVHELRLFHIVSCAPI